MDVIHESSDALVLTERAIALRAIGAVFLLASAIFGIVAFRREESPAEPLVVAGIFAVIGAMMSLLPARHTFAFSRSERRLVVVRERPWKTTREEYALRDVADAYADSSRSSKGGETWRVVVQLTDGRSLPVTSYYSSGYESKRAAADRIRAFLEAAGHGVPVAPARADARRSPHAIRRTPLKHSLLAVALVGTVGSLFAGIGGTLVYREQVRLSTWIPVDATVISAEVAENSDSDGSTFAPVVVYRYHVNGRPYTSNRVHVLSERRSGDWAHEIVAEYSRGDRHTAWYNPADPGEAFLRRTRSLLAPIFALVGSVLVVVAAVSARSLLVRSRSDTL